ncbi:MAG TPA: hypothetical protein DCL43_15515 [Chitinophagaceae bacterium]|nr:hypothetical protein [Chitinophagaceae bacterium]HAN38637.1 hypothetical protein [Chitinophagaceae bacterium]
MKKLQQFIMVLLLPLLGLSQAEFKTNEQWAQALAGNQHYRKMVYLQAQMSSLTEQERKAKQTPANAKQLKAQQSAVQAIVSDKSLSPAAKHAKMKALNIQLSPQMTVLMNEYQQTLTALMASSNIYQRIMQLPNRNDILLLTRKIINNEKDK